MLAIAKIQRGTCTFPTFLLAWWLAAAKSLWDTAPLPKGASLEHGLSFVGLYRGSSLFLGPLVSPVNLRNTSPKAEAFRSSRFFPKAQIGRGFLQRKADGLTIAAIGRITREASAFRVTIFSHSPKKRLNLQRTEPSLLWIWI